LGNTGLKGTAIGCPLLTIRFTRFVQLPSQLDPH
jgi:hypothetical protein